MHGQSQLPGQPLPEALKSGWAGGFSELAGPERPLPHPHCDHAGVFLQVFYTQSLLEPLEDEPPICTTLLVRLSSRACWASDEAARLIVMHRNDNGTQLVVTTFELKAEKFRARTNILGKGPCADQSAGYHHCSTGLQGRFLTFPLGQFFFPLGGT